jgi:hypothetical protein
MAMRVLQREHMREPIPSSSRRLGVEPQVDAVIALI